LKKIKTWIQALRLYSLTASAGPVLLVGSVFFYQRTGLSMIDFMLALIGILSLHIATNLVNDYFDFKFKIDRTDTKGSSGVLVNKLLAPELIKKGYILFYLLGLLIGSYFIYLRGVALVAWLIVGLAGSYFYTAGKKAIKYIALGEIAVFLLMGPFLMLALYFALTGRYSLDILLLSLPVGLLTTAILTANNFRDFADDKRSKIKTIATVFGVDVTRNILIAEILSPYLLVVFFVVIKQLPVALLTTLFSLPLAWSQVLLVRSEIQLPVGFVERTAQLQFLFVLLLSCTILIGSF